jgi:hypothetical protein
MDTTFKEKRHFDILLYPELRRRFCSGDKNRMFWDND